MPFRVFNGKVKGRLVLNRPTEHDSAVVVLRDGTEFTVAPSFLFVGEYPGIRAVVETLPTDIQEKVKERLERMHTHAQREITRAQANPWRREFVGKMSQWEEREAARLVLCNNLVIGRGVALSYAPDTFRLAAVETFRC